MQQESPQQALFRRGAAMLCVLALLSKKECYGYELCLQINKLSDGGFTMAEGTLYPILYRMEDKGYVNVRYAVVGRRMRRSYYSLSEAGKEYYQALLEEYRSVQAGIENVLSCNITVEESE